MSQEKKREIKVHKFGDYSLEETVDEVRTVVVDMEFEN